MHRNRKPAARHNVADKHGVSLAGLLESLGVENDAWDFLIVGDGSGSSYDRAAGWASVSIERQTMERRVWWGAVNAGTVNFAEAMAYLQPLNWLACREDDSRRGGRRKLWRVHIVTDSTYCRDAGASRGRTTTKHLGVWSALDSYVRQGFVITWHHRDRNDVELNRFADRLSRMARVALERYNRLGVEERDGDAHRYNPAAPPSRRQRK